MKGPWDDYAPTAAPETAPVAPVTAAPAETFTQPSVTAPVTQSAAPALRGPWDDYAPRPANTISDEAGPAGSGNLWAGTKLALRSASRAVTSLGDAAAAANYGAAKLGYYAGIRSDPALDQPQGPSSLTNIVEPWVAKHLVDIRTDKDAGKAMQYADMVGPVLAATLATGGVGDVAAAVDAAPTLLPKIIAGLTTSGKIGLGAVADTALGYQGQKLGNAVAGPAGGFAGGLIGGGGRSFAENALVSGLKSQAVENAADVLQAGKETKTTVDPSMLTGHGSVMQAIGSVPVVGRLFSQSGKIASEQEGAALAAARRMSGDPELKANIGPGGIGGPLQKEVQTQYPAELASTKAEHAAVQQESIRSGAQTDLQPALDDLERQRLASGRPEEFLLNQHVKNINDQIEKANPGQEATRAQIAKQIATATAADAKDAAAHAAAATQHQLFMADNTPVVLKGTDATDYLTHPPNRAGMSRAEYSQLIGEQRNTQQISLQRGMPGYDAEKLARNPAPVAPQSRASLGQIPTMPARVTTVPTHRAINVQSAMYQSMQNAKGRTFGSRLVKGVRNNLRGRITQDLNSARNGLGQRYRNASEATSKFRDKEVAYQKVGGKYNGQQFETFTPPISEVGADVREGLTGQDPNYLSAVAKAVGEKAATEAAGRALATVGRTGGKGSNVVEKAFNPRQFASNMADVSPQTTPELLDMIDRNTPTGPGQLPPSKIIQHLKTLGETAYEGQPAGRGLTRATVIGGALPHVVGAAMSHPISAAIAGIALHNVMRNPTTLQRIVGNRSTAALGLRGLSTGGSMGRPR